MTLLTFCGQRACVLLLALSVAFLSSKSVMAADTEINAALAKEMDWPHWRGPEMNGISRETGLVEKWSPKGENLLYKSEELAGNSTPIVMNGKLYVTARKDPETEKEGEQVICADAATGKVLWRYGFNVYLADVPDTRVGWSSVVGDPTTGNVYALGVCDYFVCLNGETGEKLWDCSLSEQYGALNTYGGRTNYPVIYGDLAIISSVVIGWGEMAKPCHRFIAFDKRNGQVVWFSGTRLFPYDTTYSSPITTVIGGQPMLVFGSGDGALHSMQPRTGKLIWSYDMARRGLDSTPLIVGDTVFAGNGEEVADGNIMGTLVSFDGNKSGNISKAPPKWIVPGLCIGKSAPTLIEGKLVAIDNSAKLYVVNPETGKMITSKKLGTIMTGSPLYADGKIYACENNGRFFTFKFNGDKLETLCQLRLANETVFGSPIVSHGRLYVRSNNALYCIGKEGQEPKATPRPAVPTETPVKDDPKPALVQVVPVEALLLPGQNQQYQVRLFNARGQFLRVVPAAEVKFALATGDGQIDAAGKYHSQESGKGPSAVIVRAKVGDLTGEARIRIVPDLPLKFDFEEGEVPITWVGARYRNLVIDYDFYEQLKSKDPRAAELYIYFKNDFVSFPRPKAAFDDTVPARPQWTQLLRYLQLDEDSKVVTTLEGAKEALDPALKVLQDERVIKSWDWSTAEGAGNRLTVIPGDRKIEGNAVMVKNRTIPLGTRSQSWMGHTFYHDYTIQADVMGNVVHGKIPDIGLIGQRYILDLMGAAQQLQIRTWAAQLRMTKNTPYTWKPHVWYTLKFQTAIENDKAVLRGKVWPRGEAEPEKWMVEAVDESPNLIGSPGLFGNAQNAEIFLDNVKIWYNSTEKKS